MNAKEGGSVVERMAQRVVGEQSLLCLSAYLPFFSAGRTGFDSARPSPVAVRLPAAAQRTVHASKVPDILILTLYPCVHSFCHLIFVISDRKAESNLAWCV